MSKSIFINFTSNSSRISLPRRLLYADAIDYTMSSKLFLVLPEFGCPSLHTDFSKLSAVIRVTSGPG